MKPGADNQVDTVSVLNGLSYFREARGDGDVGEADADSFGGRSVVAGDAAGGFSSGVCSGSFCGDAGQVTVKIPSELLAEIGGTDRISVSATPIQDLTTLVPGRSRRWRCDM